MRTDPQPNVFITGASQGLGLALADCFLRAGWGVFAGVRSQAPRLTQLPANPPGWLIPIQCDVSSLDSIRQATQQIAERATGLDVLVNNAAVHLEVRARTLETLDLGDGHLERTLDVNACGPLRVAQQCLPLLESGQRKLILNISSEAGSISDCWRQGEFAYCMSKAALNMQTRLLANYLQPRGYHVLAIHPGWMRTAMGGLDADIHPDEAAQGIYRLVVEGAVPPGELFLNYTGQPLRW
jgi:NAD(P)-dependent dehydrogenase (short-subunit alcohol dehydrogenase family)